MSLATRVYQHDPESESMYLLHHRPFSRDPLIPRSFTWRAVIVGLLVGVLINLCNTYYGLQTGAGAQLPTVSALLGYLAIGALAKFNFAPLSKAENVLIGVMHACAHDMHMTCLLGAAALLHDARKFWSGTVIILFQPNEERLLGAKAVVDDRLFSKIPLPSVCLAQDHCCGMFHAGTDASIIPEYADFQVDVRTFSESTQTLAKSAVERIIRHECEVSGSLTAPRIVTTVSSPAIDNDDMATSRLPGC
ncbi:unnamed protein product [Penicillium viridicatum]